MLPGPDGRTRSEGAPVRLLHPPAHPREEADRRGAAGR
jgi:hypothetical protein